ncbi:MAG: TonB-dependent receptor [Edaphobacter sp.]|nr:TonB-dependent receptor [Edaphobacter sp.]
MMPRPPHSERVTATTLSPKPTTRSPKLPLFLPASTATYLYGANIGGPIYIPHVYNGHNKSFFFFNWESGTAVNGTSPTRLTVPTTDEVTNGNFQGLKSTTGALITLKNPFTGQPFPNNHVDPSLFSPQAVTFLKFTPSSMLPSTAPTTTPPPSSAERPLRCRRPDRRRRLHLALLSPSTFSIWSGQSAALMSRSASSPQFLMTFPSSRRVAHCCVIPSQDGRFPHVRIACFGYKWKRLKNWSDRDCG